MRRLAVAIALFTGVALGCELLVKLDYEPHPDPAKEPRKYQPGDAVVAREDGQPWGGREKASGQVEIRPLFWRIRIPGVEAQTFSEYLLELRSETTNQFGVRDMVRRRQWQITTNTLPADWHQKLMTTGELTVRASPVLDVTPFDCDWSEFRTNIINHATGQRESRRIVGLLRQTRLTD